MIRKKIAVIRYISDSLRFILTRRQKLLGLATLLLSFISAVLQMLGVSVIIPLVSLMTEPEKMMRNEIVLQVCDLLRIRERSQLFILLCAGVSLLYIIKNLFCVFYTWFSAKYSALIERELALRVMENYMHRPYDFFLRYDSAQIMRDAESDPEAVKGLIYALFSVISEVLTVVLIFLFIVVTDWQIAVCLLVIVVLCLVVIYAFFKERMKRQGALRREATAIHQKVFYESVEGIKEIQVMRRQEYFLQAYRDTFLKKQRPEILNTVGTYSPTYVIEGLFVSGLMLFIGLRSVYDEAFVSMLPLLASYAMGAVRMLPSMGRISSNLNGISYHASALQSMVEHLRDIEEPAVYVRAMQGDVAQVCQRSKETFERDLVVRDVGWHYAGSEKQVLDHLNLTIQKGKSVGIIGASGAGKSTLADIILGLHIPQSGEVLLDGINIFSIPDDYARIIGYVPQSIYLVDGTIRENVAFGEEPERIDDAQIWTSLKQAQLADFIREQQDGLDTVVGERGIRFSGGQRQRLAIARALYRKPQILILDEATSALDNETEAAVMEAIEHLYGTITMIIIAHRLTTVAKCDVVYEIRDGKAVETKLVIRDSIS